jgi:hypothetical protein
LVLWEGREVQCKRLFDALAVDWFDAPGCVRAYLILVLAVSRFMCPLSRRLFVCSYTQVSWMLLLSKLQSAEHPKNSTDAPIAEGQLCDSLSAMGLEETSNAGVTVVDVAWIVDI